MTHKEFYIWLEGYLTDKTEIIYFEPILKKMEEVKDIDPFFPNPRTVVPIQIPRPENPFKEDGYDDLGRPPKIVL